MTRTALAPIPRPTPSPIFAPEDSPPGPDVVDAALAEGDEEGLVVGIAIVGIAVVVGVAVVVGDAVVGVDDVEELELAVEFGFSVVSVPLTTKSPSPAL